MVSVGSRSASRQRFSGKQPIDVLAHSLQELVPSELLACLAIFAEFELYFGQIPDRRRNRLDALFVKENACCARRHGLDRATPAERNYRPAARHGFDRNHPEIFLAGKDQAPGISHNAVSKHIERLRAQDRDGRTREPANFIKHLAATDYDELQFHFIEMRARRDPVACTTRVRRPSNSNLQAPTGVAIEKARCRPEGG